ncbi:MAG: hypothetical protein ACK54C_13755 [Betaproteobacteria bacterium]
MLVYNNLDPLQMFGTGQHDFLTAMYGDLTIYGSNQNGRSSGLVHGRNQAFRGDKNTTFSVVGWLHRVDSGMAVHIYENMYATTPLDLAALPKCLSFNGVAEAKPET